MCGCVQKYKVCDDILIKLFEPQNSTNKETEKCLVQMGCISLLSINPTLVHTNKQAISIATQKKTQYKLFCILLCKIYTMWLIILWQSPTTNDKRQNMKWSKNLLLNAFYLYTLAVVCTHSLSHLSIEW